MFASLLEKKIDVIARSKTDQTNVLRQIFGDLDGARANRPGAAQQDYVRHMMAAGFVNTCRK